MTLVPEMELRKTTIPIFFDMMQREYYSAKNSRVTERSTESLSPDVKRENKGNFKDFERELIVKLDTLIEAGSGDELYKELFRKIMLENCSQHIALKESGTAFVELVSKLMESLLEYRTISMETTEIYENQMSCILKLAEFYNQIKYEQLYSKYLKKLCNLHEMSNNWAEAAFTLLQYTKNLKWTDKSLKTLWEKHKNCRTHRELKEKLYEDAINYFEKGSMWEMALSTCKELVAQYEEETFEYDKLEEIHQRMAKFYRAIMSDASIRPDPEYFRVAFYGRGFPAFLQNKVFVYRGKGFELLPEFQSRMLDQFPNAEIMKTLEAPSNEEKEQPVQLLQINKVDPIMGETKFEGKFVNMKILNYYKVNEVSEFTYSRPFNRGQRDKDNEFATLWIERTILRTTKSFPGILQWFPLAKPEEVIELDPLSVAIETMRKANDSLETLILEHKLQNPPNLKPLSMKLNGIIDAAVMGGTEKYEKAFFIDTYLEENPQDYGKIKALKDLIAEQIPLLAVGVEIHDIKKTDDLKPLHAKLEEKFSEIKDNVEEKYGRRTCNIQVKRDHRKSSFPSSSFGEGRRSGGPAYGGVDLRNSYASQSSVDTKTRMLSAIGIARKKSTVSGKDENRTSWNNRGSGQLQQQQSTWSIAEQFNNGDSSEEPQDVGNNSPTLIVTQIPMTRKPFSDSNLLRASPTHRHSRSPSINSNKESLGSDELEDGSVLPPPPVPPKNSHRQSSDPENVSTSSADETPVSEKKDEVRHVIIASHSVKKKAPPPPPPVGLASSMSIEPSPPTPPKKLAHH